MTVFLTTVITCSQALGIVNRITNVVGLTPEQRIEIISEIRKVVPSCPVKIKNNVTKPSSTSS
jgi:hypothetical protein